MCYDEDFKSLKEYDEEMAGYTKEYLAEIFEEYSEYADEIEEDEDYFL